MQRYGMRRVDDWVPSSIVAAFLLGRLWLSWLHSWFDNLTTNVMYILPFVLRFYDTNDTKPGSGSITLVKQ